MQNTASISSVTCVSSETLNPTQLNSLLTGSICTASES